MPGRATVVDKGPETALAVCPLCPWRLLSWDEAEVRKALLAHAYVAHDLDEGGDLRATQRLWLSRHGHRPLSREEAAAI